MKTDNDRLVRKAINGNPKAFEQLLKFHYDQIYRTAFLHVQNEADALDVVQEAAYQAYKSIHSLRQPEYFMTWFTRIVMNCAADIIRKRRKLVPLNEDVLSNLAEPTTTSPDDSLGLLSAIRSLKENYRTAIILFYYHDYSIRTISEIMEVPEGTVKTYLSRGKAALKKDFEGEEQNYG